MTPEERIAALERGLSELLDNFREYGTIHQYEIGQTEAYRAAITALIACHPDPERLTAQLAEHVARPEAEAVFQSNNEERLRGLQDAQAYLLEVCEIAGRLHRTP